MNVVYLPQKQKPKIDNIPMFLRPVIWISAAVITLILSPYLIAKAFVSSCNCEHTWYKPIGAKFHYCLRCTSKKKFLPKASDKIQQK
jgi:hypothetical protein